MRGLHRSVIEIDDCSPIRMTCIVQHDASKAYVPDARRYDDCKRMAIHIVLFPRHLVVISFE